MNSITENPENDVEDTNIPNINYSDVEAAKSSECFYGRMINSDKVPQLTGLGYHTFYTMMQKHKIKHYKIGRKLLFDIDDISEYILSNKEGDWTKYNYSDKDIVYGEKLNINACSELLGIVYNTFYSIMKKNNFPCIKYGNSRVFLKEFILDFFNGYIIEA